MKQFLQSGERVIKHGPANLFKGIEAVGGKLYLTDKGRLVHVPHSLNVQRSIVEVEVSNIIGVQTGWTKFLGIPLAKNGLFVKQLNGADLKYVVFDNRAWEKSINAYLVRN